MKARHIWVVAALVGALAGCGGGEEPAPKESAKAGAQQVVDAIAAKWPLPNPADNTASCKAKADSTGPGCLKLITTDSVSVYEFADDAAAKHWAQGMGKVGDTRQAGRYALSWTARDQDMTSKEARADMVTIAKGVQS